GSIVQTQNGEWYIAYLCARPLPDQNCPLGRETALQQCYWSSDGWLRLSGDSVLPLLEIDQPNLPLQPLEEPLTFDDFNDESLNVNYHTLRVPSSEDWLSLKQRPGYLRLRGRESLTSHYDQSVVARKIQSFYCNVETVVEFEPTDFTHMAGLICMFDEDDLFYLRVSHDGKIGKHLGVIWHDKGIYHED